jgi:2-hydroxychromene-2-carboxylate isomerase
MTNSPVLEYWFELASHYSYLATMRIERVAEQAGVALRWRPFLLGALVAGQPGSPPFGPVKAGYIWRDAEREAAFSGLTLIKPDPFPQNSVLAARVAALGCDRPWIASYVRAISVAQFGRGLPIADPATIRAVLADLGLDAEAVLDAALSEENKPRLRTLTEEARARGVFGAPTFIAPDGELFWGHDRLERAVGWAAGRRAPAASSQDPVMP